VLVQLALQQGSSEERREKGMAILDEVLQKVGIPQDECPCDWVKFSD